MKRLTQAILLVVTILSLPARASVIEVDASYFDGTATRVDFEGQAYQQLPTIEGVRFVFESPPSYFSGCGCGGLFGVIGLGNIVMDPFDSPRFSDLALEFGPPLASVGGWVGNVWNFLDMHPAFVNVSVFDGSGKPILDRKIELAGLGGPPIFFGFASEEGIGRIEWRGGNSGFFAVDDLLLGPVVPVPEPADWALFGGGLATLRLFSGRKRLRAGGAAAGAARPWGVRRVWSDSAIRRISIVRPRLGAAAAA